MLEIQKAQASSYPYTKRVGLIDSHVLRILTEHEERRGAMLPGPGPRSGPDLEVKPAAT